jgi:mono/diheme cytochrome c family protein
MLGRLFSTLGIFGLLAGCSGEQAANLETGHALYAHYCADCHKDSGDGVFIKGVPPVHSGEQSLDAFVAAILGHNRPESTRMPVFKIGPEKALLIARYIREELVAD